MDNNKKTKSQLLDELTDLRRQVRRQVKLRKALEESEEKYRAVLENIEDGYYEVDLTGEYTYVNPSVCRYHGRSPDELIGQSYRKFFAAPESAQTIFNIFNEIYRTGIPAKLFNYQIIRKDGEIRDLEMSASLIRDAKGNPVGFRGISRDVTERKRIAVENERYRDFFENIEESCFEQDLAGNYTFINEAACLRFGYTREEILGMNFRDLTTPETAEKLVTVFNQVYRTGTPSELLDIEVFDKGKKPISIQTMASLIRDPAGKPIGFRGFARDITERKKIEADKERYRDFVENITDGCWETDLTGKITFANESACRTSGYSRKEFMGMDYRTYTSPETSKKLLAAFNEVYRTGLPSDILDYEIIHKDGKIINLETSVSLIRDKAGNPIGFRGIDRNVTERKKMEAEQERYRDFIENMDDACFELDLRGKVIFGNNVLARKTGYTPEEYRQLKLEDRYASPEEAQRIIKIYTDMYQKGKGGVRFFSRHRTKEGKIITLETSALLVRNAQGKPVGFRGITRDITERKKMEAEQERYRDFVENITDGCVESDLAGNTTFVNEAACRMYGYPREELIGMNNRDRVTPETAKRIFKVFNEIYRTGIPAKIFDYPVIRKDGEIRHLEVSGSLIRDPAGNPIGFRGVSRDVTERKKMEAEQERYRDFIENMDDVCFEVDLAGKLIFGNNVLPRMLGYTPEEYWQLKRKERYATPEEAQRIFQIYNDMYRKGKRGEKFYASHRTKEGKILTMEVSALLVRDAKGNPVGFRGIGRDVTERIKMEAENERYREFVENIADGCYEQDLEGNYTFINEAACRRFGYTREEFLSLGHRNISNPEEVKKMFKVFNEVYRTGLPSGLVETENFRKDGQVMHIQTMASLIRDSKGNPVGFRGVSRDVTELKKLEAEQERSRAFVENISDGVWENDLAGNMTFVNEATCRMFGYPREELIGMNNRAYTSPETAKRTFKMFNEIYRTGTPAEVFDYEIIRKDGEIRYLQMSASLIRDSKGNPIGFRGVSRDVTEQKKMEAETLRLTEQLNQARKLEAIGTLAGGIAHEFNNMLMGIQGYTSLMLLDIDPSHPFYEKLKAIESQVVNAAGLTGQLLGYARGGRYEIKTTNLNELISKTASMFGRTKKEIIIHQTLDKTLWTVDADQGQLEQVLLHLFMNAWQAMPAGGSLYLQTENVMLDESYVKSYETQPGPYVKISVTDTGLGMDVNTKERIFEPFFKTKEMGRGAGLGLASAYGIIRGHGGIINVYSEKGYGTTFNIYLPASKKEAIPERLPAREIMNRKETILLVDDEKIITDVAGAMITRLGYQLQIAHNGEEAVEMYQADPDRIDLVIMDMIMPGIGGGKAFDLIQSINPQARIILSSGFSLNGEAKEIMNRGAKAFLQKPFLIDDLSRVIREVVEDP